MKYIWILGGAILAVGAWLVVNQQQLAPVNGVDTAAGNIGASGAKQRAFGTGGQLKGKVEQGAGSLTGDADLNNQGAFDEAKGAVKDAAGKAAQAIGSTLHDVNS